jgi:21S rRNA (uridine2791-2'-O)-methyltransferase
MAALVFAFDTLKTGGHFLCKYYKGAEEKAFETKLKHLFAKVHREKPESSRAVCDLSVSVVTTNACRNPKRRTLWHWVARRQRPRRRSSASDDLHGAWLLE